jgi:hypothetical protein
MRGHGIAVIPLLMFHRWWLQHWRCMGMCLLICSNQQTRKSLTRGVLLMRDLLTTVFEILGAGMVVAGVGLAFGVSFALITAGVLMISACYLVATR